MGSMLPKEFSFREPYLQAAETIRRHKVARRRQLAAGTETKRTPSSSPIDREIQKFKDPQKQIPLTLELRVKGTQAWSGDFYMTVYSHIEAAFTAAGLILGGGRGEFRRELQDIRDCLQSRLIRSNSELIDLPLSWSTKLNRAFREGILPNRRRERSHFLMLKGGRSGEPIRFEFFREEVQELINLIENDLAALRGMGQGRSTDLRKIIFVRRLAAFWIELTGCQPSFKLLSRFDAFLTAAWQTGFENDNELRDVCFERAMAHVKQEE